MRNGTDFYIISCCIIWLMQAGCDIGRVRSRGPYMEITQAVTILSEYYFWFFIVTPVPFFSCFRSNIFFFPCQQLNPLKTDGSPASPLKSSLKASNLAPLRGSAGEPVVQTSTGPRLSMEGAMRSSAEAYLRGSTDVCIKGGCILGQVSKRFCSWG